MVKRSRTEYSFLNILTGLGGYVINTLIGLVCRMVFTRTLATDYLGVSGLFTNILTMLSLAELGIGGAINFALYKPLAEDDTEKISSLVQFYGKCYRVIGAIVALIGIALSPFLGLIIREQPAISENLRLIYFIYLFNTASTYFFSYRASLINAAQRNYIVTGLSYVINILQSLIQIGWLLLTHDYLGYLIILSASTLVFNVLISWIAKKEYPYIAGPARPLEAGEKKALIRNVRALTVWKLSGLLVNSTDNIIITYFRGLATVGLSSNYTLLSGTLSTLLNQVFSSLTASVGNLNAVESEEKKLSMFYNLNFSNFWFFGWCAIGVFVCSTDIVRLLFGENYALPLSIPFVIALNFYMVGMQNTVWTYKNTLGLFRPGRYLLILTAAINLGLSLWWGRLWGLFGILLATAVSRLLTNTWYDPYAVFKYGLQKSVLPYFRRYGLYAVILAVTGAISYFICSLVPGTGVLSTIGRFLLCCTIPNLCFFLCFSRTEEFQYFKRVYSGIIQKIRLLFRKTDRSE